MTPLCPYCGKHAQLKNGQDVYPGREFELSHMNYWVCQPCDARIVCRPRSTIPVGRLANAELRAAKVAAHKAFDPLWRSGVLSKTDAYNWLAFKMRLPVEKCQFGFFTVEQCMAVVAVCLRRARPAPTRFTSPSVPSALRPPLSPANRW